MLNPVAGLLLKLLHEQQNTLDYFQRAIAARAQIKHKIWVIDGHAPKLGGRHFAGREKRFDLIFKLEGEVHNRQNNRILPTVNRNNPISYFAYFA